VSEAGIKAARQSGVSVDGVDLRRGPALAGSDFFEKFLRELFVDLGGNWKIKSSMPTKIQGIGARKFVEM
jgi:hypothetical protein